MSTSIMFLATSFTFFSYINKYIAGRQAVKNCIKDDKDLKRKLWLWRNTFCSLLHSAISSLWVLLCYWDEPKLLSDMVLTSSKFSVLLVMFSTGYFFYDLFDLIGHEKMREWELLIHHISVITAFMISVITSRYQGFAVCSLIMEVNSIFLHIRRLMRLEDQNKSFLYSLNGVFLLITLIFCRICMSGWMIRWLLVNYRSLPFLHYVVGLFGMVVITVNNIGLMYRLWVSELKNKKGQSDGKM
ncbi:TLC domain-containing protein 2 [Hydra vulgaris]|uniref:TLC domain-containing protein 2 n=1 Tax=Hydra vulgaris TaxID=6087 RepID=A0ABM4DJG1_HYDVU